MREKLKRLSVALCGNERRGIVVVTHRMFMKVLPDESDVDLLNAGCKSYTIDDDDEDRATLVPVNEAGTSVQS
jgi:hypothetical protein